MNHKMITVILALCILLTGCAHPVAPAEPLVSNTPPVEQDAPQSEVSVGSDTGLMEAQPSPCASNASKITCSYTGLDDGMFQAVYFALTQTTWSDIKEALSSVEQYLPAGNSGSISTNAFPQLSLLGERDADSRALTITKDTIDALQLAYICVWGNGNYDLIIVFDIQDNGAYVPLSVQWIDSFDSDWRFERHGNKRWFIAEYVYDHGTGIRLTKTDWYDLESNSLAISYLSSASEVYQPQCPLGYWSFGGKLSEPLVTEGDSGFTIEMDAFSILQRLNSDDLWIGDEYRWEHTSPVIIRYDTSNGKAYAETGDDHWYYHIDDHGGDVDGYCAPFIDELIQASAGDGAGAWWAKWMLEGGNDWEAFFKANQLADVEAE